MPKSALTGSRIREHRLMRGFKQADLARQIGISASYLNLIEHNRRRIGGKTLLALSDALGIEAAQLSQGVEQAVVSELQDAASADDIPVELDQIDELVARFPGWAAKITAQHRQIQALEQTVGGLNDRLTHDPVLSEKMHEVLSTVAAIRSTASILVGTPNLGADWQTRFYNNIDTESRRLADSSATMAAHLDRLSRQEQGAVSAPEAVFAALDARGHYIEPLEQGADIEAALASSPELTSGGAQALAREVFAQYQVDARTMPMVRFAASAEAHGCNPAALAAEFRAPIEAIFRRLASLPRSPNLPEMGLVSCDASGALIARKSPTGFALPRFGAGCPLWPLFSALATPGRARRDVIETDGGAQFLAYAVGHVAGLVQFDAPPNVQATMLLIAQDADPAQNAAPVGASCRICTRDTCAARREPSILEANEPHPFDKPLN